MGVPSRTSLPRRAETWVAVGIGVLIRLLVWGSFNGHSGLDRTPGETLAVRFFLILLMTWMLVAIDDAPAVGAALGPSALIALFGVALPLYLLQVGIRRTEPITASILLTLSPLFAYVMQLADHRLTPSVLTLGCVAGIVALVSVGTVARLRHDREAPATECAATV